MKRTKHIILVLVLLVSVLCGCGSSGTPYKTKKDMREAAKEKTSGHNEAAVYYTLPSPLEVAYIIQSTGVDYDLKLLHKTELGVRYSTNRAAAINLGIYGADLSYSIYFNQQQVALKYLDCIKDLSNNLDISDAKLQDKLKEMEENIQNRETLKKMVSQTFFHSDALLKESSRKQTAVMVAAGMWIESLYISTQLSYGEPNSNPRLSKSVIEQGLVFEDLYNMLSTFSSSSDIEYIKNELMPLKNSFKTINKQLGNTYLSSEKNKVDAKLFEKLCEAVKDVRNNFTQLF